MSVPGAPPPLADLAAKLSSLAAQPRLFARLAVQDERLHLRLQAKRFAALSRLCDALAKFGGGSFLTALLLLLLAGRIEPSVIASASAVLLIFLGGSASSAYHDRRAARTEFLSERLDVALEETER